MKSDEVAIRLKDLSFQDLFKEVKSLFIFICEEVASEYILN